MRYGVDRKSKVQAHDLQLRLWTWASILSRSFCTSSYWGHLTKILWKILPGVKEIWSGHKIKGSNTWPAVVTLILSWHGWVTGSAHHLTEVSIWPKLNENSFRSKGDMAQTRNSRLKLVTFNCDLYLESAWLSYGADTKFKAQSHGLQTWTCPRVCMVE